MPEVKLKFIAETALMTRNIRLANPLDKYCQAIGQRSGKQKKTLEDYAELGRIEWEGGMYMQEGRIVMPSKVINKTLEKGAMKQKNGTKWRTGCLIKNSYHFLHYKGKEINIEEIEEIPNPALDPWLKTNSYQTMVRVNKAMVPRTRPIFEDWWFECDIIYDASIINPDTVLLSAVDAGRLIGFCEWRPFLGGNFGRFRVEAMEGKK